jgi:ribosome-associated toxin RatA of RatAB toxin-antitoxin module
VSAPRRRLLGAALLLAALCASAAAAAAEGFQVLAKPQDGAVFVDARATVHAPHALIWGTLTDYDHLAEFIPGMRSSRTTERRGPTAIVEQKGEAGFFVFSYGIDVVVASTEQYPHAIEIAVLSGNLKRLDGRYKVEPGEHEGSWVVRWEGLIEPALRLPRFLELRLIRSSLADQFRGMIDEIERREGRRRLALP